MSRINLLLRASLESSGPMDHMASLEAYEEYRIALEDHNEAVGIQDRLIELSDNLTQIEACVSAARDGDGVTEDQVELQVAAVNAVREVIDGDITEISMESFDTIEQMSLEASDQSKGLIRRMWEGLLAMLKKIKEAFKKMWAWIFSSEKRAKETVEEIEESVEEIIEESHSHETKDDSELDFLMPALFKSNITIKIPSAVQEIKDEIERTEWEITAENARRIRMGLDHTVPNSETVRRGYAEAELKHWEVFATRFSRDYSKSDGVSRAANRATERAVDELPKLLTIWKRYPDMIRDVTVQLKSIGDLEIAMEREIAESIKYGEANNVDLTKEVNEFKVSITRLQKMKSTLMMFMKSMEQELSTAKTATAKVAKSRKKNK